MDEPSLLSRNNPNPGLGHTHPFGALLVRRFFPCMASRSRPRFRTHAPAKVDSAMDAVDLTSFPSALQPGHSSFAVAHSSFVPSRINRGSTDKRHSCIDWGHRIHGRSNPPKNKKDQRVVLLSITAISRNEADPALEGGSRITQRDHRLILQGLRIAGGRRTRDEAPGKMSCAAPASNDFPSAEMSFPIATEPG